MTVFLCEDSPEGIFSGVSQAWESGLDGSQLRLELENGYNYDLFSEYRKVPCDFARAERAAARICREISDLSYTWAYRAALARDREKADAVYRFLDCGFMLRGRVTESLQFPEVQAVFRRNRAVANETHLLMEFLRFSELPSGVLFAAARPEHDVVPLMMPHFSDRMMPETFIIYDEGREKAGVHVPETGWYMVQGAEAAGLAHIAEKTDRGEYAALWKSFFEAVAIPERRNPTCQRTHLPLRFRPFMTEFQSKN